MSLFDTFFFDEDLYDDSGAVPGPVYGVITARQDFRAAITPGSATLESAPVANTE